MKNKVDVHKLKEAIDKINKKQGTEGQPAIQLLSKAEFDIERTPTGLYSLDEITGGGIPSGRLTQFFGPYSGGKTSTALLCASKFPLSAFIDGEHTFVKERSQVFGVQENSMLVHRPDFLENAFEAMASLIEAGIPCIIFDSVVSLAARAEWEADISSTASYAVNARFMSAKLPVLTGLAHKHGTAIIFINQVRANMKAMMFGDPYDMPGGHALKHQSSLIVKVVRKEWLKAANQKLGQTCKFTVTKNKVGRPQGEAEWPLIFSKGFLEDPSPVSVKLALNQARKEFLQAQKDGYASESTQDEEDDTPSKNLEEMENE